MAYAKQYYSTAEILSKFKPSLTNYFTISINEGIDFYAYEAVIPGASFETTQVFGDVQGLTQTFANKKVYPPVDVSFYVDYEYKVLKYFEDWMEKISKPYSFSDPFSKFNYPNTYKSDITIVKFEKEFRDPNQRLSKGGTVTQSKYQAKYTLRNAYPTNLISVPISYENSGLLRTTVTFNYDRYHFEHVSNQITTRSGYVNEELFSNRNSQPGSDTNPTAQEIADAASQNGILNGQSTLAVLADAGYLNPNPNQQQ